jgi:hypothetical protein
MNGIRNVDPTPLNPSLSGQRRQHRIQRYCFLVFVMIGFTVTAWRWNVRPKVATQIRGDAAPHSPLVCR